MLSRATFFLLKQINFFPFVFVLSTSLNIDSSIHGVFHCVLERLELGMEGIA